MSTRYIINDELSLTQASHDDQSPPPPIFIVVNIAVQIFVVRYLAIVFIGLLLLPL